MPAPLQAYKKHGQVFQLPFGLRPKMYRLRQNPILRLWAGLGLMAATMIVFKIIGATSKYPMPVGVFFNFNKSVPWASDLLMALGRDWPGWSICWGIPGILGLVGLGFVGFYWFLSGLFDLAGQLFHWLRRLF